MRAFGYILLGSASSAAVAFLLSGDWCFTSFSAAVAGGLSIVIVEYALGLLRLQGRWRSTKTRVIRAVLVGIVVGLFFRLSQEQAFEKAFGVSPPSGVRDFDATMLRAMDTIILFRFTANRETIDQLIAKRAFEQDRESVEWYGHDWSFLWGQVFSSFDEIGGEAWQNVAPMAEPELYRWRHPILFIEETILLWDADSGRAYVLYLFN